MIAIAPSRNHALDTLRALAIIMVMAYHIGLGLPTFLQPIASIGWMGVDLFFVLSGYLIGTQLLRPATLGRNISLKKFYARRAWRILPAYLVVLALYFLFLHSAKDSGLAPAWKFLTFTLNFTADNMHTPMFTHMWSLCVEEHFYLVLPLLTIALLRRPSARKTAISATVVFLSGVAIRAFGLRHLQALPPGTSVFHSFYLEHIYYPTWTRLDGLLAGVLIAATQLFRPLWWQTLAKKAGLFFPISIIFILIAAILFSQTSVSARGLSTGAVLFGFPIISLGFACLLISAVTLQDPLARRVPGASNLAVLAFSLYLTHPAIFRLVQIVFPTLCQMHPVLSLPVYAIAALIAASLLYFIVERPCLMLRDRRRDAVAIALAEPAI